MLFLFYFFLFHHPIFVINLTVFRNYLFTAQEYQLHKNGKLVCLFSTADIPAA